MTEPSETSGVLGSKRAFYEPWFKAWLILMPTVGLGSYYLTRNAWRRIQAILQGEAGSVWDAPPIPEATEPPSFILYGITAALIFSFFWIIIARLYVAAQASQRSKPPHE
ncbi:MAG: hypothetical protein L7S62_01035 [Flavobacteriales bacterium]|nr:hypothetical protein [Flavobacteriales bacterium]